jgi:hypothetical protein
MGEVVCVGAAFAVREVSSVVQADPFMSFLLRAVKLSSGSNGAESWCLGLASNVVQKRFREMGAGAQTMAMCSAGGKDVYAQRHQSGRWVMRRVWERQGSSRALSLT